MSGTATFKPKVKGAITGYLYELDQGGMMAVAVFEGREAYLANAARAANQVREKVERGWG